MHINTIHDTGLGTYLVTLGNGTAMSVPKDTNNSDYARAQAWIAAGGTLS